MKPNLFSVIALMLVVALPVAARAPKTVLEDGREVSAEMIRLPSSMEGTLDIQGCSTCKRLTFTLSHDVQFFIGNQLVSLADLKRHFAAHPSSFVLVVSPLSQNVVTRIKASPPDAQ